MNALSVAGWHVDIWNRESNIARYLTSSWWYRLGWRFDCKSEICSGSSTADRTMWFDRCLWTGGHVRTSVIDTPVLSCTGGYIGSLKESWMIRQTSQAWFQLPIHVCSTMTNTHPLTPPPWGWRHATIDNHPNDLEALTHCVPARRLPAATYVCTIAPRTMKGEQKKNISQLLENTKIRRMSTCTYVRIYVFPASEQAPTTTHNRQGWSVNSTLKSHPHIYVQTCSLTETKPTFQTLSKTKQNKTLIPIKVQKNIIIN